MSIDLARFELRQVFNLLDFEHKESINTHDIRLLDEAMENFSRKAPESPRLPSSKDLDSNRPKDPMTSTKSTFKRKCSCHSHGHPHSNNHDHTYNHYHNRNHQEKQQPSRHVPLILTSPKQSNARYHKIHLVSKSASDLHFEQLKPSSQPISQPTSIEEVREEEDLQSSPSAPYVSSASITRPLDFEAFVEAYRAFEKNEQSRQEAALYLFSRLDINKEGFLTAEKLKCALTLFKVEISAEEVRILLKFMNVNDNKMSFHQFKSLLL